MTAVVLIVAVAVVAAVALMTAVVLIVAVAVESIPPHREHEKVVLGMMIVDLVVIVVKIVVIVKTPLNAMNCNILKDFKLTNLKI